MRCQLVREYRFEAAHSLPRVPPEHKCRRVHGHGYRIEVTVEGEVDPDMGWLIDLGEIDKSVTPLISQLDHRLLNDLPGLSNPTCEMLAAWLWERLAARLDILVELSIWETPSSRCVYRGA